jgi:hypothetical protein
VREWRREFEPVAERCYQAFMARKPDAMVEAIRRREIFWRTGVQLARRVAQIERPDACPIKPDDDLERTRLCSRLYLVGAEALSAMIDELGWRSNPYQEDRGPTVEVLMKPARRDPILRLAEAGVLDRDQVSSAREIGWIVESVTADVKTATSRIVAAGRAPRKSGRDAAEMSNSAAHLHALVYRPWFEAAERRDLRPRALLDIIVGGVAIAWVARQQRMRQDGMIERLADGLDSYRSIRQAAPQLQEISLAC